MGHRVAGQIVIPRRHVECEVKGLFLAVCYAGEVVIHRFRIGGGSDTACILAETNGIFNERRGSSSCFFDLAMGAFNETFDGRCFFSVNRGMSRYSEKVRDISGSIFAMGTSHSIREKKQLQLVEMPSKLIWIMVIRLGLVVTLTYQTIILSRP